MDQEDPIHRLLQTTGWSCDDLLKKLQKYKTPKDSLDSKQTSLQSEKIEKDPLSNLLSNADQDAQAIKNQIAGINNSSIEIVNSTDITNNSNESFSDTDDEEQEVIATNSSIINEIIEDIEETDEANDENCPIVESNNDADIPEVTEVRVIEIDEGDADNDEEQQENILKPEEIESLEKYNSSDDFETITIETDTDVNADDKIDFVKIPPDQKYGVVRKYSPKPRPQEKFSKFKLSTVPMSSGETVKTLTKISTYVQPKFVSKKSTGIETDPLSKSNSTQSFNSVQSETCNANASEVAKSPIKSASPTLAMTNFDSEHERQFASPDFRSMASINKMVKRPPHNSRFNNTFSTVSKIVPFKIPKTYMEDYKNFNNQALIAQRLGNAKIKKVTFPFPISKPKSPLVDLVKDKKIPESARLDYLTRKTFPESEESENDNIEYENTSTEAFENIRNNLKLQLNSLRTKKKSQFLETSTKVIDNFQQSKKLSMLESLESSKSDTKNEKLEKMKSLNQDHIYTQTNELGLVILDVKGGVEIDELEGKAAKTHNNYSNTVKNNVNINENSGKVNYSDEKVLDEIRKIINKQKQPPKLSISKTNDNSLRTYMQKRLPKTDEDKKMDISCENSRTSFTEVEEKSPFVSDTLDEFLTADSKLNISYQVPKLGAEEGLKNITEESPLILKRVEPVKEEYDVKDNIEESKTKITPTVKAKTVAQKRRLLEKERKKQMKRQKKKKLKELKERVKEVAKEIKEIKMKKNVDKNRYGSNSFVLYNNNKIWIESTIPNKCIARINCTGKRNVTNRRKLSLLNQHHKKQYQVKYSPGPLCKKRNLQLTGKDKWETEMVKLPKVYLEVAPQPGKPFCDTMVHRLNNIIGGELDTNKIEFALSAVKSKNDTEEEKLKPVQFPLEYHNKVELILTRQPRKIAPYETISDTSIKSRDKDGPTDAVADVIEGLIRYVEIKELAPSLIKEDDIKLQVEDDLDGTKSLPTKENVSVFKKSYKRRSKVECELLRLSCKVVNVEVEENQDDDKYCSKPYCRLGCVCKSLKCEYVLNRHCQKPACMFHCTCPEEKPLICNKLTFPAGTNLLSVDTVNRIEDEAKKHLAKVEKEFTQTVIHTNDKTIVVGIGDRTKTRRTARLPAKFSDFVSSSNSLHESGEWCRKNCVVSLAKLNLSDITPFCLTHSMHNCFCKGLEIPNVKSDHQTSKKKSSINIKSKKIKKSPKIKTISSPDPPATKTESESDDELWTPKEYLNKSANSEDVPKRPARSIKRKAFSNDFVRDMEEQTADCARVVAISKKYKRSLKYSPTIYQDDFVNCISDSDLFRYRLQLNTPNIVLSEADLFKQSILREKIVDQTDQTDQTKNKTKRKQTLESREDITPAYNVPLSKLPAIQRRKKLSLQADVNVKMRPVFDGEIIIDRSNMDLLRKMGPRTVAEGYARLIPWTVLITSFYNKSIQIWSMIDQPSRLLINTADKICPKNYVDIRKMPKSTEVITWIKDNHLPPCYQADSLSFILKETKNNFEICGICTKNIVEKVEQQKTGAEEECNENAEIFYHKDMMGIERFFMLHKDHHKMVVLAEDLPDYFQIRIRDLRVALPPISSGCKWRMLLLNSDFTFLFFRNIPYSIRYTDLLVMVNYARANNCTVRLENKEMLKNYKHQMFGVYFEPSFSDRIFIGPYSDDSDSDDVETLRYINKSLVSTKSFNMMRGKGDYKCGHWLIQTTETDLMQSFNTSDPTIDLTSDNELETSETVCEITKDPSDTQEYYPFAPKIIHNKQEVKIIDAPPRKPEDFNRYIITNIPHFGYLGAFMHPHGEIDVSWPFENKLLRFRAETAATSFLQERFSSLLQSVPETFKISIIVALNVDLKVYKPIDSGVLNGHYICGDFGYMNILETSEEDCITKVGVSKDDILKLFTKRAQNFVRKKLDTLSYLLQIPKSRNGCFDLPLILKKAAEEIHHQLQKERDYRITKNALFLKKRENALKLHKLLSQLPKEQRNIENVKFRAILHKTEQMPIVINDSDDETNKQEREKTIMKSPTTSTKPSMKSILKPLVTVPIGNDNVVLRMDPKYLEDKDPLALNTPPEDQPRCIAGVKFIKNTQRGFMLINDPVSTDKTEVIIKDNKIVRVINAIESPVQSKAVKPMDEQGSSKDHAGGVSPSKSAVIELEDDDVIPVDNEPMIIDLDDFPSDDD